MTERQQQIMEIGKGMMEPIFMGQLPELMKNYKDEETDILAGLEERLGEVFQKAQQMQKADRKGKICTMGISYLQSSVLTGNYELRLIYTIKSFIWTVQNAVPTGIQRLLQNTYKRI